MNTTDARDAARLVHFAIDVRAVVGADEEYHELWRRYRIDDTFRQLTDAVCSGFGLSALAATEHGLIVIPQDDSVFAMGSLSDFEEGYSPEQRLVAGLAHLAIAACAYPRTVDLERPGVARVKVSQVERLLRDTARTVNEDDQERDEDVVAAFEVLAAMPTRKQGSQRRSRTTSLGVITNAFERLIEHGCARKVTSDSADAEYQLLDRYRLQVGEVAINDAYEALVATARASTCVGEEPGDPAPVSAGTHDGGTGEESDVP